MTPRFTPMTIAQVARVLGVSRQDVSQKVMRGMFTLTLESVEVYRRWRHAGHNGMPAQCPGDMAVKDYAALVGVSLSTAYALVRRGAIPGAHRHGHNVFVPRPKDTK